MLLAHAPTGYLVTRILSRTIFRNNVQAERNNRFYQILMIAGIVGGIAPDFDFLYQIFFAGNSHTSHHAYITHLPVFWMALLGILLVVGKIRSDLRFSITGTTFCVSALLHLVLDTLTGVIYWLYPLSSRGFNIFKIADIHIWWVHNYMYHWTFLIEITIIMTTMIIFLRVRETVAGLLHIFENSHTLRMISLRLAVCTFGICMIILVGSLRFSIDNRLVYKIRQLKHVIVQMVVS